MKRSVFLATLLLSMSLSTSVWASPILGTFTMLGDFTLTTTSLTLTAATIEPFGTTGDFTSLIGTTVTIDDLSPVAPFGVDFTAQQFLSFDSPLAASFPSLDIDFILAGIYGAGQCGVVPAVGQTCTPAGISRFSTL